MEHIELKSNCHVIVIDDDTSIVMGSPPDWIKSLDKSIPFPQHIFLGDTILYNGHNIAEIEFPIYRNFFFKNMRKTHIIAPGKYTDRLRSILEESLLGPDTYRDEPDWQKARFFAELLAVRENFNPSGRPLGVDDFALFQPYTGNIYGHELFTVAHVDRDSFLVKKGNDELKIELQYPEGSSASKKGKTRLDGHLSVFCFDSGDGFSPNKQCTSFMVNAAGRYIVFDPNARSLDTLTGIGIDISTISAIFISHIHADHDQGLYRFLRYRSDIPVFTGNVVYDSLKEKIEYMIGDPQIPEQFTIIPLETGKKIFIEDLNVDIYCDMGFHSIPSTMSKIYFRDSKLKNIVLAYSGDTIFDPGRFGSEGFPERYRHDLEHFMDDATHIIHEAGAGLIHTDPEDMIPFMKEDQHLLWVHTPRTEKDGFTRGHIMEKGKNLVIV